MTTEPGTLDHWAGIAAEILTAQEPVFTRNLGAAPAVDKGPGDWATAADLQLERDIGAALIERTGVPVHGEEHGGPPVGGDGPIWVLDPIDGTANFSAGMPLTSIALALVEAGEPVVGLVWLPLLDERYHAVAGGPAHRNGVALPALEPTPLTEATIAVGSIAPHDPDRPQRYPFRYRMAVLAAVAERAMRVRVLGSAALDLAWVAGGMMAGALSFGNYPWDSAAGTLLIRAAGGEVADLEGGRLTLDSTSILAGRPDTVSQLIELVAGVGEPADYA